MPRGVLETLLTNESGPATKQKEATSNEMASSFYTASCGRPVFVWRGGIRRGTVYVLDYEDYH